MKPKILSLSRARSLSRTLLAWACVLPMSAASEREVAGSRQKIQELTAERDQLVGGQTQSQSVVEASERQLAAMHAKIQELNSEKDQLTGQIAQARSAVETAERLREGPIDQREISGWTK